MSVKFKGQYNPGNSTEKEGFKSIIKNTVSFIKDEKTIKNENNKEKELLKEKMGITDEK